MLECLLGNKEASSHVLSTCRVPVMMHFTCIIISFDLYEVGLDPSFYDGEAEALKGSERPCLWPRGS